jgi:triosephosphate isomerase
MAKRRIIVGNWKMNPEREKEAELLFKSIAKSIKGGLKTEIVICPPFVYLKSLKKISPKISLGAQNSFFGEIGPFTGEVSSSMLSDMGVRYVILGHSERRAMGEDNTLINKKIKASIGAGLRPILCVGETMRDKEHEYFDVVKTQIKECLQGIPKDLISKVIVAYEPVWAISTTPDRKDATPADSLEMAIFIRKILSDIVSTKIASGIRIIYGGSVNDRDAGEFLAQGGVDGLLVGKASLDAKKFSKIVEICEASKN